MRNSFVVDLCPVSIKTLCPAFANKWSRGWFWAVCADRSAGGWRG